MNHLPKNSVAFKGVPVEGCTLANQQGTSLALPITQRYLAWPSMATKREATIPKLAPAPTTLLAQFHPTFWKTVEKDASLGIYISDFNAKSVIRIFISLLTLQIWTDHLPY